MPRASIAHRYFCHNDAAFAARFQVAVLTESAPAKAADAARRCHELSDAGAVSAVAPQSAAERRCAACVVLGKRAFPRVARRQRRAISA
ncbi:hypothetical protein [Xanthomonas sp. GW]|uniref:hypothetical protein n=1 Tax=Xanthomonas sp. GW TaxID=2724121 RepID=UPI00163ABAEA|nr:hypothetical protein [Xanthomonas sp. GW]